MSHGRYIFTLIALVAVLGSTASMGGDNSTRWTSQQGVNFTPDSQIFTLEDLGYTKDETLQGVMVSRSYTINWPDAWDVQPGNSVTLIFSHSPILEDYSSMAVDWNGVRLGSVLFDSSNVNHGSLTLEIPEDAIEPGYNELRLELYMGIYDDPCEDPNNPATWATIHRISSFEFSYELNTPEANLSLFPAPILDNSAMVENQVTFVIPEQASLVELNAVTAIAAKLGQLAAWRTLNINTTTEQGLSGISGPKGDIIYVGRADQLSFLDPEKFPFVKGEAGEKTFISLRGEAVDPQAGVLWIQVSESDPTTVDLIVTGMTDEAVLMAGRALANSAIYPRLKGQLGIVLSLPETGPSSDEFRQVITLEELGYADQTAYGTLNQRINFIIPLSMKWQVATEASLDLHFAHSELLHPKRSSLTVTVNGSPVGSILLDKENANNGNATFIIPARLLEIGDNKLTVITNIDMIDEYEHRACTEDYYDEAWVAVYSDSSLKLPSGPASVVLDLADYPFAFIGLPDLTDTAFIVPDPAGLPIVQAATMMAGRLGRYAEGEAIYPKVADPDEALANESAIPYQFIIGQPTENEAIYQINDILPLPFVEGSNQPQESEAVAQILAPAESVGYIQAAMTDGGNPRLVVTGDQNEGVLWAAEALSDPILMKDLKGDLAILDAQGTIVTAYVKQPESPPIQVVDTTQEESENAPVAASWIWWLSGGLFVISIIILLVLAWRVIASSRATRKIHEV
jgi:hypothetical protein